MGNEERPYLTQEQPKWIRVFTSDSEESQEAVDLLKESGFVVVTVDNQIGSFPEVWYGSRNYVGLYEIKELLDTIHSGRGGE